MTSVDDITREYRQAGAFSDLVGLAAVVDRWTFLTKAGHLLQVLRVEGIDPECLDHSQLDHIARRFEAALRILPASFRLYQLMLKRDHAPLPAQQPANSAARWAVRNRVQYLEAKADQLYTVELYLVLVYESGLGRPAGENQWRRLLEQPRQAVTQWLSQDTTLEILERDLLGAVQALATKVSGFGLQLRDVLPVEALEAPAAFSVLARLLNYAPGKADVLQLRSPLEVDYQLANSSLECHRGHLELDGYRIRVLTLKDPPARTFPGMLGALADLPGNLIAVSEWKREDDHTMRRAIHRQRRHHHNSKSSLANFVPWADPPTRPEEMLIDDSEVAQVADLGQNLRDMEVAGRYFGQFSFTVILYGLDPAPLERSVAECFKIFSNSDAALLDERYNLLNAWLAAIPGNEAYNLRRLWLMNCNYADLSFLFAQHSGATWNRHLDREYLALLETNHAAPYFLNLHCGDVAHTLILGSTGSGKSFLLNFLLTHLQKYDPFTCIFDLGGSYQATTQLFGGTYVRLDLETPGFQINPFSLAPNAENLNFLCGFLKVLVESSGYRMDNPCQRDLFEAITSLYQAPAQVRRLGSLAGMVRKPLAEQLYPWTASGQWGSLFDNLEDNLTFARFATFDFEGMNRYPQVLEPLLFYVLHRASAAIGDSAGMTVPKWFIMDEAWRFFQNCTTRQYIIEALKTWRKRNAALILATQSGQDLEQSEILPILLESCPTKIFLANPALDEEWYARVFKLNVTEAQTVARLIPKRQFLLKRPDHAKVLNLNVDPQGYWLYTNSPYDNQRKREAFAQYGFERGLQMLAGSKL